MVAFVVDWVAVEACLGAAEDFGLALVRHMGSWDPFQQRIVVGAEVAGAVAVVEVGAEEEHFQAAESAADAVAANDLGAAHSAAVGHLGVEDSAAVAAAAAQEEKRAEEDTIDRLVEAQNTAVDPAVDPAVGLSFVSVLFRNVDTKMAHHNHLSPVVLQLISRCLSAPRMLLTRVKVTTWWWTAVSRHDALLKLVLPVMNCYQGDQRVASPCINWKSPKNKR